MIDSKYGVSYQAVLFFPQAHTPRTRQFTLTYTDACTHRMAAWGAVDSTRECCLSAPEWCCGAPVGAALPHVTFLRVEQWSVHVAGSVYGGKGANRVSVICYDVAVLPPNFTFSWNAVICPDCSWHLLVNSANDCLASPSSCLQQITIAQ